MECILLPQDGEERLRRLLRPQGVPSGRQGYTFIEVLVVLAILALLIGLLMVAVQKARESSAIAESTNNLQQLGLACHRYHDQYKYLPYNGTGGNAKASDRATQSWAFQILPCVEQDGLFQLGDGQPASPEALVRLPVFSCPGRGRPGFNSTGAASTLGPTTDYALNPYLNDSSGSVRHKNNHCTLATISDGTSYTVLCGHQYIRTSDWSSGAPDASATPAELGSIWVSGTKATARDAAHYIPDNSNRKYQGNGQWGGPFATGGLFCMADGSVHLFPFTLVEDNGVSSLHFRYLFTPRDGQSVQLPE
jgi:prepilin-type N-terminal cleavage/methylation domain-containing protein